MVVLSVVLAGPVSGFLGPSTTWPFPSSPLYNIKAPKAAPPAMCIDYLLNHCFSDESRTMFSRRSALRGPKKKGPGGSKEGAQEPTEQKRKKRGKGREKNPGPVMVSDTLCPAGSMPVVLRFFVLRISSPTFFSPTATSHTVH